MHNYKLCSLSFKTTTNYKENLNTLLELVNSCDDYSLIVAPEVCLSGFDYDNLDAISSFSLQANIALKKASKNKIIILTIIEKIDNQVFNFVKIFHNEKILYQRAKAKLFLFGGEHNYFSEGKEDEVAIVEVDGLKIGLLVCFELRFKDLWKKLEGADIIALPSWWGVLRTEHFTTLSRALAIMNQCYVVASDSANEECTKMSGIINPQGDEERNGNKPCLELEYNKKEISLMRRYMDVGIGQNNSD